MLTECSADLFGFAPVEGREVVAAFDGGAITSDAGALLLGVTDHVIRMTARFAACFHDVRRQDLIEHEIVTLVGPTAPTETRKPHLRTAPFGATKPRDPRPATIKIGMPAAQSTSTVRNAR